MLKIQRQFIDRVRAAKKPEDLFDLVQAAIRLEHATIPPYLTAMLSLHPEKNREIWSIIHSVVVDEMLHMTIACNLLNALGRAPLIDHAGFVTKYPGPLPLGISSDLQVGLEPFSTDLMKNVFMKIEEPEKPIEFPVAALAAGAPQFATIGQFYAALIDKLQELGPSIFVGASSRQVVVDQWYAPERMFPIVDTKSAVHALKIIVEEGEGTPDSPLSDDGDFAHYYRFEEVFHLRRLVRDPSTPKGFSFSGAAIPFDSSAVYPLTPNQKLADLDPKSEGARRANQFAFVYTKLLKALQRVFDGDPAYFDTALGVMFELKLAGQIACALPAIKNGQPTGQNVGPAFFYQPVNA
ncbi:MAG TPA: ferritin-like protein [Tepidisphaeraceae bacterium]|nr:ferritin-like protein [Tepidisphaeraceae bacterium]